MIIKSFLLVSKDCYDWGRRNVFRRNFIFLWFEILQRAADNAVAGQDLDQPDVNILAIIKEAEIKKTSRFITL